MKAILLARVSSKDQEDNNSIPSQTRRLSSYAEKCGFTDTECYQLVESSTKSSRKEFSKMIDTIKNSKERVALIADTIDRLQRSFKESVLLDELRKGNKVELHFVRESLVIHQTSNSADILRWDMGVMFAKSYVTQLSDNVKRGQEQAYLDGSWPFSAPFGYRNVPGDIVPDGNAQIVRDIFGWYGTDAYSIDRIRELLRERYGIKMSKSQVDVIIERKFYYGVMTIKGSDYRHRYPTLISKEIYDSAQAIKHGRSKQPFKYAGLPFFYRGLITCRECGCIITAERSKGHVYYHCTQYKGNHRAPYIREEDFTAQLKQVFEDIKPTQEQFGDVMASLKSAHQDKQKYEKANEARLRAEMTKLDERKARLLDLLIDGMLERSLYTEKLNDITSTRVDLEQKLNALDKADDDFFSNIEKLVTIARHAPLTFESSKIEARRELLKLVLSNLELDGRQLRYKYKKPFDLMASCTKMNSWQG